MTNFDSLPNIFYLGFYHPLYNHDGDYQEYNEYFNKYSQKILDFKNRNYEPIQFFTKELDNIIDDEQVVITTVPSSNANCISSGIIELSKQLIKSKQNLIDGTTCIKRIKSIPKQSHSSETRTTKRDKDSIEIQNKSLIKDKKVILLDDVLTTGNTVQACKELLLEAGAKEVKIIVLGKTIRDIEDAYYLVKQKYEQYIENLDYQNYLQHQAIEIEKMEILSASYTYFQQKHEEINEWANDEHEELDYFYPNDDDEHDYIDQEAEEKHYLIMQEDYECTLYIEGEAEKDHLNQDEGKAWEEENYMRSKYEIDNAIEGNECLSTDNPFLTIFRN